MASPLRSRPATFRRSSFVYADRTGRIASFYNGAFPEPPARL